MRTVATLLACLLVPALAGAQRASSPIKRTNPPELPRPTGYTHVVEVTGLVKTIYIAGQVAADKDGNVVGGTDMKAQAEQVFKNLQTALAAAGATFADVVKMNTYATDLTNVQAIRDVRARYFGDVAPASTLVQVVRLARPEYLLEIEVVAVVPPSAQARPVSR
jgi:enamine deaminase RidA (YjgF/YER057c/UK114 family)